MSWDKEHDYRMRDLEVLRPIVSSIASKEFEEIEKLKQENASLVEANKRLKLAVKSKDRLEGLLVLASCTLLVMLIYVFCFCLVALPLYQWQ